jgi:hypothetical protein
MESRNLESCQIFRAQILDVYHLGEFVGLNAPNRVPSSLIDWELWQLNLNLLDSTTVAP